MTEDKKPYEVVTRAPETAEGSPAALMLKAMAGGMDLDKLERFMLLQEKYEANQARKAYTQAMSDFKKAPPEIEKDRHVEYKTTSGVTKYDHASLGNVTAKINVALGEHGLSAAWTTDQTDKGVSVTCKITHVLGHFETTTLAAAHDSSGGKNAIQALGSTISYLQRYTLLSLTGLASREMDDDAQATLEYVTEAQISTFLDFINSKGVDTAKFLLYMGAESVEKILTTDFDKAVAALKIAKGKTTQEKAV
ncbi:MAG: ERF family protein [Pseudomonadota bacterium]